MSQITIDQNATMNPTEQPSLYIGTEIRLTLTLALPLIATSLAQMGLDVVDTVMLGRLGPQALASGTLGLATFMILAIAGIGILTATGVLTARAHGAQQHSEIPHTARQSLWLALIISVPVLFCLWGAPYFLLAVGQNPLIVHGSAAFLHGIMWGIVPLFCYIALREFTTALTHTRAILLITLLAIPVNALGNYGLMYGKLGMPRLGIFGVGLATALVEWMLLILIALYIRFNRQLRSHRIFHWEPLRRATLGRLWRLGWPVGLLFGFEIGLFAMTAILMGYFGATALAAHQIAIQSVALAFMFPLGISQATAIRIGHSMGAGNVQRAQYAGWVGTGCGLVIAFVTAVVFWRYAGVIVELFLGSHLQGSRHSVMQLAVNYLHIATIFQLADAVQVISNGALRGLKDTFIPMLLGLISYWCVGLGSGYYFGFILGWQGQGLWWGLALGITVSALLLKARFIISIKRLAQTV